MPPLLLGAVLISSSVEILSPVDGQTYGGDWLTLHGIVTSADQPPESVVYHLNGSPGTPLTRWSTDWYTYMANDDHTGSSESPSPRSPNLFWTAPVTGYLHEFQTPVIVDGIVYQASSDLETLFALKATSGEELWRYEGIGWSDDAVTVTGGSVYLAADSIWCLDASDGRRIWAFGGADGGGGTPVVRPGEVYVARSEGTGRSTVLRLDSDTGEPVWSTPVESDLMSCMAVWEDLLIVPTYEGPLLALHADYGDVAWQNSDAEGGYWDSSPALMGGRILIGSADGCVYSFEAATGQQLWHTDPIGLPNTLTSTPSIHEGLLFAGSGDADQPLYSFDAISGSTVWCTPFNTSIHGSTAVADGLVIWGTSEGVVHAVAEETGEPVWQYDTGAAFGIQSSPAVTDGIAYIAVTDGNLYAFGDGMGYTYQGDLHADQGWNVLEVVAFEDGEPVASDTIGFFVSGYGAGEAVAPGDLPMLLPPFPNPCTSFADLRVYVPSETKAEILVYGLDGRLVDALEAGILGEGFHLIRWDAAGCSVGAYCIVLRTESGICRETLALLRRNR